jgi:hypothetical protein
MRVVARDAGATVNDGGKPGNPGGKPDRDTDVTRAQASIVDQDGNVIAERTLSSADRSCSALARGIGVWASLVLEQEAEKAAADQAEAAVKEAAAHDEDVARAAKAAAEQEREAASVPPVAPAPAASADLTHPPVAAVWPAPAVTEASDPDMATFLVNKKRSIELGAGGFLLGGYGGGGMAGASVYGVVEVAHGWFLRPSLGLGRSAAFTESTFGTWGAGRLDACGRIPGYYRERRGIQLDLCAGTDVGFLSIDGARTVPIFTAGPSAAIRGELASDLSVEIRGVAGINLLREGGDLFTPSLFMARTELGFSWRLR